MKKKEKEEDP